MKRNITTRLNTFLAFTPIDNKGDIQQMYLAAQTREEAINNLCEIYSQDWALLNKLVIIDLGRDTLVRLVGIDKTSHQVKWYIRHWIITDNPIYQDELMLLLYQAQYGEYTPSHSLFDILGWINFYWDYKHLGILGTTNKYIIPFKFIQKVWQFINLKIYYHDT